MISRSSSSNKPHYEYNGVSFWSSMRLILSIRKSKHLKPFLKSLKFPKKIQTFYKEFYFQWLYNHFKWESKTLTAAQYSRIYLHLDYPSITSYTTMTSLQSLICLLKLFGSFGKPTGNNSLNRPLSWMKLLSITNIFL